MPRPIVDLELQTPNLARPCACYNALLGWRSQRMIAGDVDYHSRDLGLVRRDEPSRAMTNTASGKPAPALAASN